MEQNKSCITINCGCCSGGDNSVPSGARDGTPVGTVIAYMGSKAPQHYLTCDGAVLHIADYPLLSQQIQDELGAVDYFGGDGATTFALPDLRNEFLRGYHVEAVEQLSEEIGKHQDATIHSNVCSNGNSNIFASDLPHLGNSNSRKADSINQYNRARYIGASSMATDARGFEYTSRPTNVAVLFCIKYE